jgi:hypothetical protein
LEGFTPFQYCTKVGAKRAELVQFMHNFMQRSRAGIFCNEHTRSTPLGFVVFRNILLLQKSSCNEVVSEFFTMKTPDAPHWTHNSCFGVFRTVSLLHESQCKMGKLVYLMHKFMQRSLVGIICNKRTRSTLLDLKLMVWGISNHFVTPQKLVQNSPKWCN